MRKSQIIVFAALFSLLAGCISIGDLVWVDENANGIQDPGEPGLEGVTVTLFDGNGVQLAQTTTDVSGLYTLQASSNDAPSYYLEFSPPAGYGFTAKDQGSNDAVDSDANPSTGQTDTFPNQGNTTGHDAGLIPSESIVEAQQGDGQLAPEGASIGNFVWHDDNQNGIQDEDEIGFEAVQVSLFDADGNEVGHTITDADGFYQFDDLLPGAGYYLGFTPPETYLLTDQDQGANDSLDSDADPDTGETAQFVLAEVGTVDMDAGLILPAIAAASFCYGPGAEEFPEGVSPLTGLPVGNPAFLGLNPVFLSVSIFPPQVRPPTGLAVAPMVYQLYIGDGDTRLLAAFYGEFPQPTYQGAEGDDGEGVELPNLDEGQYFIGDQVWFDSNGNALQDSGEPGVGGVPVSLLDVNFNVVQTTTTNALGYYSFLLNDVEPNMEFQIRFGTPPNIPDYYWVTKDVGDDDTVDSDATGLGRTDFFDPTEAAENLILHIDAGLRQAYRIVGLRSGRVAFQDIQVNYCGCIVGAGADTTLAAQIRTCANAFGDPSNIGGAGLDVLRLQTIAEFSTENSFCTPNFTEAALICSEAPAEGGQDAQELYVQYNVNNISHFVYDEGAGAYLWYLSVPGSQGDGPFSLENVEFELMTDRLTGEVLTFENVVVMNVNHVAENTDVTIIGLDMAFKSGMADLLRNGQIYEVNWSTSYPDYVTNRDQPLPVHFELDGEPFPMAPGQTWINLLNQFDTMDMIGSGIWLADFDAPSYSP